VKFVFYTFKYEKSSFIFIDFFYNYLYLHFYKFIYKIK